MNIIIFNSLKKNILKMKNISEKQFNELSKQSYMDSSNSRKANMDKFNYKSDPILQQNEYYVSNFLFNFSKYITLESSST